MYALINVKLLVDLAFIYLTTLQLVGQVASSKINFLLCVCVFATEVKLVMEELTNF